MRMNQTIVPMRMRMRLAWLNARSMGVLVVLIVNMSVLVLNGVVPVRMLVPLCQVQPNACPH